MEYNDLPTHAELERRLTIAEANRFDPTRPELDSVSIAKTKDNYHRFTETSLYLHTTQNRRSTIAVANKLEQIVIKPVENLRTDSIHGHPKLYFKSASWFDRLTDALLPLCVGRSRAMIEKIRAKSPWDVNSGILFNMSGTMLRPENILTPGESEHWAQEIGGKPFIKYPPKSSLNDKEPAFGIIWRSRRQEEEDPSRGALACPNVRQQRPRVTYVDLMESIQGSDDENPLLTYKIVYDPTRPQFGTVPGILMQDQGHSHYFSEETETNLHDQPESFGSAQPSAHPAGDEAKPQLQQGALRISSEEFEVKHQQHMTKCLFEDLRPAIQNGFYSRHAKPGGFSEHNVPPHLSHFALSSEEEELLALGAIRCPPTPGREIPNEFGRNPVPRHRQRPLPSSPEECHREVMLAKERDRKSKSKLLQEREIIIGPPQVPEVPPTFIIKAQPSVFSRSSSPCLSSDPDIVEITEPASRYYYSGDKQRALIRHDHEFVPHQARREPIPVVEYVHNANRHRSKQPHVEHTESSPVPPSLLVSSIPCESVYHPQSDFAEVQAQTCTKFKHLKLPLQSLSAGVAQSKLFSQSSATNSSAVVKNYLSPESSPMLQTPTRVTNISPVSMSFLVSKSPEKIAESQQLQPPDLASPERHQMVGPSSFHAQFKLSQLSLGLELTPKVSSEEYYRSMQTTVIYEDDDNKNVEKRQYYTWKEKGKWKSTG